MRRLFDFTPIGVDELRVEHGEFNVAKRIDTLLVNPLATLPVGAFGGRGDPGGPVPTVEPIAQNLAFRNLVRAGMVNLATGQQMVEQAAAVGVDVKPLTAAEIIGGTKAPTSRH